MRLEITGIRSPSPASLEAGEPSEGEILLAEQGVYLPQGRPVWQIGELCLTSERLLFLQPRGVIFNTPLTLITEVATESKRFTMVRKMAMTISYRHPRRKSLAKAWFITPSLGQWLNHLTQMISGQEQYLSQGAGEPGSRGEGETRRQGDREPLSLSPLTPSQRPSPMPRWSAWPWNWT